LASLSDSLAFSFPCGSISLVSALLCPCTLGLSLLIPYQFIGAIRSQINSFIESQQRASGESVHWRFVHDFLSCSSWIQAELTKKSQNKDIKKLNHGEAPESQSMAENVV
jgi:hypothetical protein